MARNNKKTTEQRHQIEARRRQDAASRISAQVNEQLLLDVRRALREAADRAAFERRFQAAMAVTAEFAWQPWGYEIPATAQVRGLTVRHLFVVPSPAPARPVSRDLVLPARHRFERPRTLAAVAA